MVLAFLAAKRKDRMMIHNRTRGKEVVMSFGNFALAERFYYAGVEGNKK